MTTSSEQLANGSAAPPAEQQTSLATEQLLNSATAGVIVHRTGQIKNGFRSEGRQFARELAEYINTSQVGVASVFVFEETFGIKDKIHWLIHLRSLDAYEPMLRMGASDPEFRRLIFGDRIPAEKGGGSWDRMFVDGSLQETVMIPQFWGLYGTHVDGAKERSSAVYRGERLETIVPPAREQTSQSDEDVLHSGNAGMVLHRTGQLIYNFRSEGRVFARDVAQSINERLPGLVTVFVYENAFGNGDLLHWLIHMKSLGAYRQLMEMHVKDEDVRNMYIRERISPEKGGGTWARMFLEATVVDTALTPQHWGNFATKRAGEPE
jgi:uncharacterized protein DUF6039